MRGPDALHASSTISFKQVSRMLYILNYSCVVCIYNCPVFRFGSKYLSGVTFHFQSSRVYIYALLSLNVIIEFNIIYEF